RTGHDGRLRLGPGGSVAARVVRPFLRYVYAHLHGALSLAVDRSRGALERYVRLHRRVDQPASRRSLHGFRGQAQAPISRASRAPSLPPPREPADSGEEAPPVLRI